MKVEHNLTDNGKKIIRTSTLYYITDLKAFLWKKRDYCNLWRYHDFEYMYSQGHPYNVESPEIIRIYDTPDDLERYSEILYNMICKDHQGFNTVHDVAAMVIKRVVKSPDLGLEVIQLNDYYKCKYSEDFIQTTGLFVFRIEKGSTCETAGLMEGDVIVSIQRPELEKVPSRWKPQHLDYEDEYMYNEDVPAHAYFRTFQIKTVDDAMSFFKNVHENERLIFNIIRDGERMDVEVVVPFTPKLSARFENPKVVVKTIPKFEINDTNLVIRYDDPNDPTDRVYLRMKGGVDIGEGDLFLEIPDTVIGVRFYIDENGNLAVDYE